MPPNKRNRTMTKPSSKLVNGDAIETSDFDMIAQTINLPIDETPDGEGWRIMTGNNRTNLWARIAYRHECEE